MEHVLMRMRLLAIASFVAALAPVARAGDAAAGAKVFATECAECHSVREGKDKKGPSLYGIVGSKAAQRAGFAYSDALRASGVAWTPDKLAAYITAPKQLVPGGKMKYDGLDDARQRDDLIAYLDSATKR
jgi:cytochrome c